MTVALTASACSGPGDSMNLAPPPTTDTLCRLVLHRTTPAEAKSVLGQPTSDHAYQNGEIFVYIYSARQGMVADLALSFDGGVLIFESVENMPFPACWDSSDGGMP